jgi:hypothetical protein
MYTANCNIRLVDTMEYSRLRRVGGSLYFRVPADFAKTNDLKVGDFAMWEPNGTATFRIVKQDVLQLTKKILADEAAGTAEDHQTQEAAELAVA